MQLRAKEAFSIHFRHCIYGSCYMWNFNMFLLNIHGIQQANNILSTVVCWLFNIINYFFGGRVVFLRRHLVGVRCAYMYSREIWFLRQCALTLLILWLWDISATSGWWFLLTIFEHNTVHMYINNTGCLLLKVRNKQNKLICTLSQYISNCANTLMINVRVLSAWNNHRG